MTPDEGAIDELMSAARDVRTRAYAPYSKFHVGAAVLAGGNVFVGVNVENASYPMTVCAERNAVGAALAAGQTSIQAVAVSHDSEEPIPPCGGCRQVLSEFGPDMLVVSEGIGGRRAEWTLSSILPHAFGPTDLPA